VEQLKIQRLLLKSSHAARCDLHSILSGTGGEGGDGGPSPEGKEESRRPAAGTARTEGQSGRRGGRDGGGEDSCPAREEGQVGAAAPGRLRGDYSSFSCTRRNTPKIPALAGTINL